jgi:soluble lytic murein transglycosylase
VGQVTEGENKLLSNVKRTTAFIAFLVLVCGAAAPRGQSAPSVTLVPTSHPRLPRDVSLLWLAPMEEPSGHLNGWAEFLTAVKLEVAGDFMSALPLLTQSKLRQGPLGEYVDYYRGLAELRIGRADQARRTFRSLRARQIDGYVAEAAALSEAEADEALGASADAVAVYDALLQSKTAIPTDELLMRQGRAAKAAGSLSKATAAFERVYYEFPLSDYATAAGVEISPGSTVGPERFERELDRAERVFAAKRYELARAEFERVRNAAEGDDRDRVNLRLAECSYFLKRPREAREQLRPFYERSPQSSEVLYYHALVSRSLGDLAEYSASMRHIVDQDRTGPWAEDALNDMATENLRDDEDDRAVEAFSELYARFPRGRYAERAAWKLGWWAYRSDKFADAVRVFDQAAADFPRSDYRPAWLYWSGRAYEAAGTLASAESRYRLVAADYLNSYYGRLAAKRLTDRGLALPERRLVADVSDVRPPAVPPNAPVIRLLLGLRLYDQALDELRYARNVWGESPTIEATTAWVYRQQGTSESGLRQFTLYRGAINGMKRAYPQFMAAGGEQLPPDLLRVIFPMAYWDVIRKYAQEARVDPYLAAALIAQESTFVPDIRSTANAVGLTQLLPSTARQYARTLKLRYSSRLLVNPDANVRIGMSYLADKIREFGELHLALASYNAGERPVHRWVSERPGLDRDEFIDDIPYPQTQNYVKKILGMAEDYRRLYGTESSAASTVQTGQTARASVSHLSPASTKTTRKKKTGRA